MKHRFLCKHKYKYYGRSVERTNYTYSSEIYNFICLSCKKEVHIYASNLMEEIENEDLQIRRSLALDEDVGHLNKNEELAIDVWKPHGSFTFRGCAVDSIKRKYMKNGINLDEIPKSKSSIIRDFEDE